LIVIGALNLKIEIDRVYLKFDKYGRSIKRPWLAGGLLPTRLHWKAVWVSAFAPIDIPWDIRTGLLTNLPMTRRG